MYKKILGIFITISIVLVIIANYTFATTSTVESDSYKTDIELNSSTDNTVISATTGGGTFENKENKDMYYKVAEATVNSLNQKRDAAIEAANKQIDDICDKAIEDANNDKNLSEKEKEDWKKTVNEKREEVKKQAKEMIDGKIDDWKDKNLGTFELNANNIADWARNKVGTTIEKGVDQLIEKAISEPISSITDELFGEDSFLGNTLSKTLTSYVESKTTDQRSELINKLRGQAGLPELTEEIEKQKEDFNWAYEATKAALSEVNQQAYKLGDALKEKIEDIIGGEVGKVVGGYVEKYLNNTFDDIFKDLAEQLRESMTKKEMSEDEIKQAEEAVEEGKEGLEKEEVEKVKEDTVEGFKEGLEKAINEKISQLSDKAYNAMLANLQAVAQDCVDQMFAQLDKNLQKYDGTLGKVANSFIAGLTGQVKNWAGQNIKSLVKQYMEKWFKGSTDKIQFEGLDFNWDQVLVDALSNALEDKNLALLISVGYQELTKPGGVAPATMPYETYAVLNYVMMIRGGTLIPSMNNVNLSSMTAVSGLSPVQFNLLFDGLLTRLDKTPNVPVWNEGMVAAAKAKGDAIVTVEFSFIVRLADTTATVATVNPIATTYLGGPVPFMSDAAYVMCEMDKNTPGAVANSMGATRSIMGKD